MVNIAICWHFRRKFSSDIDPSVSLLCTHFTDQSAVEPRQVPATPSYHPLLLSQQQPMRPVDMMSSLLYHCNALPSRIRLPLELNNRRPLLAFNQQPTLAAALFAAVAGQPASWRPSSHDHASKRPPTDAAANTPRAPIRLCRRRKARTVFSDQQLAGLERRFAAQKYLSTPERVDLAALLGLSETQVIQLAITASRKCVRLTQVFCTLQDET
jgi:hypothetical protein